MNKQLKSVEQVTNEITTAMTIAQCNLVNEWKCDWLGLEHTKFTSFNHIEWDTCNRGTQVITNADANKYLITLQFIEYAYYVDKLMHYEPLLRNFIDYQWSDECSKKFSADVRRQIFNVLD